MFYQKYLLNKINRKHFEKESKEMLPGLETKMVYQFYKFIFRSTQKTPPIEI